MKVYTSVLMAVFLMSCSHPSIETYKDSTPTLTLSDFFDGELVAHGLVLDMNDVVSRKFVVKITGDWQGKVGTLHEQFTYDNGEIDTRTWHLTEIETGRYIGTANDVIGTASGESSGSAFYWRYDLRIKVDGEPLVVTLDDWMYLIDNEVLINKSEIIKYGIKVGEVILSIRKL